MEQHDIDEAARWLAALGPETDPNDWPVRNLVLYQLNDPALWASICLTAQMRNAADPVVRIWLRLEEVNGLRQTHSCPVGVVQAKLGFTKELIKKLDEDHPRRTRLLGLWAHYVAMVHHAVGEFETAAKCFQEEAELNIARHFDRYAACFMWRLEEVFAMGARRDWRVTTNDAESAGMDILYCREPGIQEMMSGYLWWRAYAFSHLFLISFLTNRAIQAGTAANWIGSLEALPPTLEPEFVSALLVVKAIARFQAGDYAGAVELASDPKVKIQADWHEYALMVQLSALNRLAGHEEKIAAVLAEINGLSHGGYVAKGWVNAD